MNPALAQGAGQAHLRRYGKPPAAMAFAPGRVEILGNHTDYNEGVVLSAAIDQGICLAVAPRTDGECRVQAAAFDQTASFRLPVTGPARDMPWVNYVRGVVAGLSGVGRLDHGFDATVSGDVPLGAGLSSSAALEVSTALALCGLYGLEIPALELAKLCQKAEHEFTGARCGLLDQFSSLFGREDCLVYSDFRTLSVESVPFGRAGCFLIADTKVKHNLVESEYNERRACCEKAVPFFASALGRPVRALRDVTLEEWKRWSPRMEPLAARRAAHVIGENERVEEGRRRLAAGDLKGFGALMFDSHESSRRQFENSCRELDAIVDFARGHDAVLGARLSGGGFGGSAVILAPPAQADRVARDVEQHFRETFNRACEVRLVRPSGGARRLPMV
ncbi:MAG: galactokinase [Lentisphaerae bacterium]|nr:galactokinase [Lentisphaerota bacterium]